MPVYTSSIEVTADYPTIKPSLNLNFARSRSLDPRITFTRASVGTYVGRDGLIKTAGEDEARFDHDPDTLESLGLLIEEQRTNQIPASDFSSGWATSNASLATGISDPEGGTNARKLVATTTNNTTACFITYNTSITTGTTYTQSVWAKANAFPVSGNAFYVLQMAPSTGFDSRYQNFDLSNGTLGNGDVEGATIEAFPNGWYRCSITQTSISTVSGRIAISLQNSPTDSRLQNISTGSANNDGIYIWGAQLEVGSFPTSYIPTSGAAVTRALDSASITGESFSSWFNNDEGTLVLTADIGDLSVANQSQVSIENTANPSGRYLAMGYRVGGNASGGVGAWYTDNGTTSAYFGISAGVTSYSEWKQSFAYKLNDFAASANGSTPVSDNTGGINTTPFDRLRFGIYYFGDTMDTGHIKSFSYYPKRLTNAQLQLLTS